MVDISEEYSNQPADRYNQWLEIAVPFFSFGGAFIAILFDMQGISLDFHIPAMGCVISSFVLAYLAWIRPKKDIVALSTPLYSIIFFIVPTDFSTGIVLQIFYAVSLTALLVRLKYRFGTPGTAASLGKELGGPLKTYIDKTRDAFSDISPETAHRAAVVFVRFAEGNYDDAAQSSRSAVLQEEKSAHASALMRAFCIIQEHSTLLHKSLDRPLTYFTFSEKDSSLLAKPVVLTHDDDLKFFTALDNALLVLYSAAWNNSERDRPHLLACQAFGQKLMSSK
ncbi:MAG: hypothetical protein M0Q91_09890 [Methanoregula sp.]|jgi:hypothetical protein|nr:hypothetical protein [Methanoregula sp.]